jgi:phenol 2-monooxygenase
VYRKFKPHPSILTAEPSHQHLAQGFLIGKRFHSAPVIRLSDARPVHLGHVVKADGRFRIFALAGAEDPAASGSAIRSLCNFLAGDRESPIKRYNPTGDDIDSVIDVRAVFQQGHCELAIEALPSLLSSSEGTLRTSRLRKDVLLRSQRRKAGCMVVVRPDQYVAHVLPLDGYTQLAAFFDGFMLQTN